MARTPLVLSGFLLHPLPAGAQPAPQPSRPTPGPRLAGNPAHGTGRARLGRTNEAMLSLRNRTGLPTSGMGFAEAGLEVVLALY